MNKTLYLILLLFLFTGIVNASSCTIVSGTGKDIGDEISCGNEHFYILSNDGTTIKMLSKYNLYVGYDYELKELDKAFDTSEEAYNYAYEIYSQEYTGVYDIYLDENNKYSLVMVFKKLDDTEVKQNSEALGAHGDKPGKPNPNQKGIIGLRDGGYAKVDGYSEPYGGGYFYDFTPLEGGLIEPYLTTYYNYLNKGYNIQSIDLLSVKELSSLVKTITGNELPLEQWGVDLHNRDFNLSEIYIVGSIKELLPEKYSWLWTTTYWTKTTTSPQESNNYTFFIDALGDLCAAGSCVNVAGAGLRPVVTMSANNLLYNIKIKTDGNGNILTTKKEAKTEENIELEIVPNEGYELATIKATNSNNAEITIQQNKFIMPSSDVLIEATFIKKEKNPETSDIAVFSSIIIIIFGIGITGISIYKLKEQL